MDRRSLLKFAAGSAMLTLVPSQAILAAGQGRKMAMVFDVRRCTGCMACTVSCSIENQVTKGMGRTRVTQYSLAHAGKLKTLALPNQCNHCEHPECVKVCPKDATYKRKEDGIVVIDQERCIRCQRCVKACPYGARRRGELMKTPPEHCNFCIHRTTQGLLPACVETCVGEARLFGDLNDPSSQVHQAVKNNRVYTLLSDSGTQPNIYYIGLPEDFADQEVLALSHLDWQR
ncbi:4Fe-4S dicluster domain-containing protein [Shewanella sp. D64]|uniref:4Fe-4S dicluster domain-containing protein n=1 Tax=unclassified Shewanella TaxID=196818 RepID=UPI0022BA63E3|nr:MULTISPECIES: 4Fe-4S dicluster domain-containing protein [unclassified Shewanella]MEC4727153.1 4Fe-4S dicluster domain-containing protein [Shewanella sp. D64]MEC4739230.1 4Fe-4S dicluster domain-containing protein [Shewanella sp. E94]WBJ95570.1 4Fe-4S dicluster domain-containing protein [Shewanella sp. MTB7]